MDELALVIHAFAAHEFVAVILGPGLLGFLQLPADAMPANIGNHAAKPVIKHARLELETDPEADGLAIHPGQQRQGVIASHEAAFEEIDLALGSENEVVK